MSELDATFKPFENNIDQKKTISYFTILNFNEKNQQNINK